MKQVQGITGLLIIAGLALTTASCSSDDFDTDGFLAISEPMVYATVQPGEDFDYYEFRQGFCGSPVEYTALFSSGAPCGEAPDPTGCMEQLAQTTPAQSGYDIGCLPACCDDYAVTENDGDIGLVDTVDDLRDFLGPVDSISDALILVDANGYYFAYDDVARSAIRGEGDGYRVIALRLVSYCAPVTVNKYLLHVSRDGTIRVLGETEDSRAENACI